VAPEGVAAEQEGRCVAVAGERTVEGRGGVVSDKGWLGDKGCGEEGRIGKSEAIHADDEGLRLGFMHEDVVEGGEAAGTGCLSISGSGVFNRADSGGGGKQVPQREAGNVVGISSDDDDDEGVNRGGGEVADAEGVKAAESAEGVCGRLSGGKGQVQKKIAPLTGGGEGLGEVTGQVFTWGGENGEG
jgi:hypothetical protein